MWPEVASIENESFRVSGRSSLAPVPTPFAVKVQQRETGSILPWSRSLFMIERYDGVSLQFLRENLVHAKAYSTRHPATAFHFLMNPERPIAEELALQPAGHPLEGAVVTSDVSDSYRTAAVTMDVNHDALGISLTETDDEYLSIRIYVLNGESPAIRFLDDTHFELSFLWKGGQVDRERLVLDADSLRSGKLHIVEGNQI